MGGQQSIEDDDMSLEVDLQDAMKQFQKRFAGRPWPQTLEELMARRGGTDLKDKAEDQAELSGLLQMLHYYPETRSTFFPATLPFICKLAADLKEVLPELRLKKLRQGHRDHVHIERKVVASILAHMFLCTIPDAKSTAMPSMSFESLLTCREPQEVAKLRMFVQYFESLLASAPLPNGSLRIYRQVREELTDEEQEQRWATSTQPMLPIDMVDMGVGFENAEKGRGCLHADFANMFLGGGVLSGGCVQEEIRFSICPELCGAMLVCPCMLKNEAITIVGAEQFSNYNGYGRWLQYAGPCSEPSVPQDNDGTPLIAICAMDALDYRGQDNSMKAQMQLTSEVRELEKAAAAFAPHDEAAGGVWPIIATGNWGCGVFGGSSLLKAVLQWLAASQGGRQIRYFPFDEPIGEALQELSDDFCKSQRTVGDVFAALRDLNEVRRQDELLPRLRSKVAKRRRK